MSSPFSEDQLRSKGFTRAADGSWSKPDPSNRAEVRRPDAQHPPEQPLEGKPQAAEPDAPCHRRCIAIVTIWTCNARDYDGAGAATKGIFDRLIELGQLPIPSDGPDFLEVVFDMRHSHSRKEERMTIEVFLDPTNPTRPTNHEQQRTPL